jgi:serine/threonine protein kinase
MPDDSTQVWRKEAIVWELLRHPHVVPFLGILGRNSSLKLVSEWMEYGTLTQYLRARPGESPIRFVGSFTYKPKSSADPILDPAGDYWLSLHPQCGDGPW